MLLASFLLVGCGGGGDETRGPAPGGGDGTSTAKVYDVFPGVAVHTVDRTYRTLDFTDDPKEWDPVFDLITQAQTSLDVAVMRINRQAFVDALLAKSATAHIRIVTEKAYFDDPLYRPFYQQLLNPLRNNSNIEIVTDNDGTPRLMHARFMIVDRAKVALGSYNYEVEGCERTIGDVLVINDSRVAEAFTNQFNQMFVERKFGAAKRDAVQHAFSVAGGTGQIEVYFGPTDNPRDILMSELDASAIVIAAVQQFSDFTMANHVIQWLQGAAGAAPAGERALYLTLNDIGVYGDADENLVYDALVAGMEGTQEEEGYTAAFFVNQPPTAVWAQVGAHLNHKFMYADHAGTDGVPSVTVNTGNWTTQGFNLNDEVIVILRGAVLSSKYHNGQFFWLQLPHLGEDTISRDFREDAQVSLMYPFISTADSDDLAPRDPALADLSCGVLHGKVGNFQQEVTYQDADGNLETINIDLQWTITGEYYFGGDIAGYVYPTYDENERTNPGHNYILVVPAGRITVTAVVVDDTGNPITGFTPQSKTIDIGPGGVRQTDFSISALQTPEGGGGPAG